MHARPPGGFGAGLIVPAEGDFGGGGPDVGGRAVPEAETVAAGLGGFAGGERAGVVVGTGGVDGDEDPWAAVDAAFHADAHVAVFDERNDDFAAADDDFADARDGIRVFGDFVADDAELFAKLRVGDVLRAGFHRFDKCEDAFERAGADLGGRRGRAGHDEGGERHGAAGAIRVEAFFNRRRHTLGELLGGGIHRIEQIRGAVAVGEDARDF